MLNRLDRLRNKANSLPSTPGVYIMKNADGEVIYVGKSKKLKNRVTSYFVNTAHSPKTDRMVSLVYDFDYILCKTEIEALSLENVLIKKHTPKYNVRLKDAKSYPYIKITKEDYPKLYVTRDRRSDKAKYFGPYRGASDAHTALEVVMKIFKLAGCKYSFPKDIGKIRPCIYRDMGRCLAPCTGCVSSREYRESVACAEWVLDGNISATRSLLEASMLEASEAMEFEKAASLRDSIRALEALREKQKVVADVKVNRDVFAIYNGEAESILSVLSVRGGALIKKNELPISDSDASEDELISLIASYYEGQSDAPNEIMLDFILDEENTALLSEYLSLDKKYKVRIKFPERGDGRALCDMALANGKEAERQRRLTEKRENKNLLRIKEILSLPEIPQRIEAYDISNIGKEHITASMVVSVGGAAKRSEYRSFNIKTVNGTPDDYASMREVIRRRLLHIGDGSETLGQAPDLILVDGGANHVRVVREVAKELAVDVQIFGMVKDDYHKTRALTDGENDISIAFDTAVYSFVYNLQEEAHRFAVKHSSGAKRKTLTKSSLENISGIGEKKAKALLSAMSLSQIRCATEEELSKITGISKKDAEAIRSYYDARKTKGVKGKVQK